MVGAVADLAEGEMEGGVLDGELVVGPRWAEQGEEQNSGEQDTGEPQSFAMWDFQGMDQDQRA